MVENIIEIDISEYENNELFLDEKFLGKSVILRIDKNIIKRSNSISLMEVFSAVPMPAWKERKKYLNHCRNQAEYIAGNTELDIDPCVLELPNSLILVNNFWKTGEFYYVMISPKTINNCVQVSGIINSIYMQNKNRVYHELIFHFPDLVNIVADK